MDIKKPTRTKETEQKYKNRYDQLATRFKREISNQANPSLNSFIDWLTNLKPTIKKPTWNQYKAAVCMKLEDPKYKSAYEKLYNTGSEGCKENKTADKTSSLKSKSLNHEDEIKLTNALIKLKKTSFWSFRANLYVHATILTGLRPCEWENAQLIKSFDNVESGCEPALFVKNAKNTNNRAHGKERHLLLGNLCAAEQEIIRLQVKLTRECIGKSGKVLSFQNYQKSCTKRIADTSLRLFPKRKKRPSLYTCRHQFSANLKNAGYPLVVIATLMGHKTDDTATTHYCRRSRKKNHGNKPGPNLPTALPSEVARIMEVHEQRSKNAPHNKSKNKKGLGL